MRDAAESPMRPAVIDVRGIGTRFGDAVVHEDVSLRVNAGEVFALVGGSVRDRSEEHTSELQSPA